MNRACCSLQNAVPEAGIHLSHAFCTRLFCGGSVQERVYLAARVLEYVRVLHLQACFYV